MFKPLEIDWMRRIGAALNSLERER